MKIHNFVGSKFGKMTILEELKPHVKPSGQKARMVLCKCDCGTVKKVTLTNLKTGHTTSCGCHRKELSIKAFKQFNKYKIFDDYVVGFTNKGETFLVDIEDLPKIKNFCWRVATNGYLSAMDKGKLVYIHRIIMTPPKNMVVDHINHNKCDNRKNNLRACAEKENLRNRNAKGYYYIAKNNNWKASIYVDGITIHLGTFAQKNEAIQARREAEKKYFGEFAFKREREE